MMLLQDFRRDGIPVSGVLSVLLLSKGQFLCKIVHLATKERSIPNCNISSGGPEAVRGTEAILKGAKP
jgi:hypothetical protein